MKDAYFDFGAEVPEQSALLDEVRTLGLRPTAFVRRPAQPPGFELVHELSRGGQGIVYEAVQRSTGRRVALKVGLARELPGSAENERFRREVHLLASLRHPSLPTVFESGVADGWRWLAMEFIEGVDLATWSERTGASPRKIVEVFVRVCEGVALAHRQGIVHRDLKPSNILVDADGKPVVLDFGIAKRVTTSPADAPDITRAGSIIGSPLWLAPEQIVSPEEVGPQADVYALGRLLYHLLSGAHPYRGDPGTTQWLKSVGERDALPLRRVAGPATDPVLEAIVMRAIERDPARRYPDAGALRADCVAWLGRRETLARPDGPRTRVRRAIRQRPRLSLAVASTVVALAVGAAGWWLSIPTRWEQQVHDSLQLPPTAALAELWELHLGAPAGVERPTTPEPGSPSGPSLTHDALLARYLAEPCLGRVKMPGADGSRRQFRTSPLGDVVVVQVLAADPGESGIWLGREPTYDWVQLPGLRSFRDLELSEDGRFLAGRDEGSAWRLWELARTAGGAPAVELSWARQQAPRLLAVGWSDFGTPGTVALTREADSPLRLVRLADGAELARLPGLTAELSASSRLKNLTLSPDGKWLAVCGSDLQPWLVSLEEPHAPPRRFEEVRARSLEFVGPTTLALDLLPVNTTSGSADRSGFRFVDVAEQDTPLGRLLFATNDRPPPAWLREHALVSRSTASNLELLLRGASEPVVRWSTPATVLRQGTLRDRQLLVTRDSDGYFSRWNLSQSPGATIVPPWRQLFPGPEGLLNTGSVFGICFSPSGARVAVSLRDSRRVRVRTLRGSREQPELTLPDGEIPNCLDWSRAEADLLAIGGFHGRVYLWLVGGDGEHAERDRVVSSAAPIEYGSLGSEVYAVALSPDGRYLLAAGRSGGEHDPGRIRVWRVGEPGPPIRTLEHPAVSRVSSLAFGGGGKWLVAGTAESDRLQWLAGPLDGELAPRPDLRPAHKRVTRDIGVHGSGVFSVHRDGTVRYRERGTDARAEIDLGSEAFTVAVHPGGNLVAVGAADGRVHLLSFDGERFALVTSIPFPALGSPAGTRRVFRVRFSPDGGFLVVGGEPGTVPCYLDLREAERYMAGNLDWLLEQQPVAPRGAEFARAWADSVQVRGNTRR